MYCVRSIFLIGILNCSMTFVGNAIPVVDFLQAMLNVAQYTNAGQKVCLKGDNVLDLRDFKELYDKHIVRHPKYSHQACIPKVIHFIWLGSPLPARCAWFIKTWKKHHPTWTFILWDDAKVAQFGLINQHFYDAATNYGEKSDIARYEILWRFGGLYVDTDFECLQPFDVFHHYCDFYVGAYPDAGGGSSFVFNGLIGSAPGHPVLARCITSMKRPSNASNSGEAIIDRTGPFHLTRCLRSAIQEQDAIGRCVPFPPVYFYPWPGVLRNNKNRKLIESWFRAESFAVHHWAVSWGQ